MATLLLNLKNWKQFKCSTWRISLINYGILIHKIREAIKKIDGSVSSIWKDVYIFYVKSITKDDVCVDNAF